MDDGQADRAPQVEDEEGLHIADQSLQSRPGLGSFLRRAILLSDPSEEVVPLRVVLILRIWNFIDELVEMQGAIQIGEQLGEEWEMRDGNEIVQCQRSQGVELCELERGH